jgi:hypothetical protein
MKRATISVAPETYKKHAKEVRELLRETQERLRAHEARQSRHPLNWGWAGDLGRVKQLLQELNEFLGDPAATVQTYPTVCRNGQVRRVTIPEGD